MTDTIRLGARLRAARKAAGFKTSKVFLKKFKIPASTYSQHESGARMPDDETLKFYSQAFDVNFDWLKAGNGQPFHKPTPTQSNVIKEELIDLTVLKKAIKKPSIDIDQKLLAKIIEKTIIFHQEKKSKYSISNVVKEAVLVYAKQIRKIKNKKTKA